MNRPARRLSALVALAVAAATLTAVASPGGANAASDTASAAVSRLKADATGSVELVRDRSGAVSFVGTKSGKPVDNPAVSASTSVSDAAQAHVDRYGAALGAKRPGTSLREHKVIKTLGGHVVRYAQSIGGVPVVGSDLVVSVSPDGELVSMLSTLSQAGKVPAASVSKSKGSDLVRTVLAGKKGKEVRVGEGSRWILDSGVIDTPAKLGARGTWRYTVTGDVNQDVFVDDQTGAVLLRVDNHHTIDRIVCDNANATLNPAAPDVPCTAPARTETGPASGVADVNDVFTFVGATSSLFQSVGVDLTALIGKTWAPAPGGKSIASTVRLCYTGAGNCPYENAFWNGTEMYYGTGLTVDDVTGHELTHGVTDRTSELFYWGQSGAINESMSDIMGEIVDHRTATAGDSPTDWQLAEQSSIGAIRNLQDPTIFSDPDRTQSPLWFADPNFLDNGGVHFNSGVGNKTAYLIMKGGTFNGQTITGIDAAGDTMPKTAALYMQALPSLASGADYADLGNVLNQSCQALIGGPAGITSANCTEVNKATVATELAITPLNYPTPPDAADTCPAGYAKRVLFESETGSADTKFTTAVTTATPTEWSRADDAYWGSVAHSGTVSWNNGTVPVSGATTPRSDRLIMANPIAVPAGQPTYMHYHGWYLLDFDSGGYYDGGTVEIDNVGDAAPAVDAASLPWVNGPNRTLSGSFANPAGGRLSFSGDSHGFVASRVDLSSYGGQSIKPQFSMNFDNSIMYIGWFVDDVTVYTCDKLVVVAGAPTIKGKARVGKKLTAIPGTWAPAGVTFTYQWLRNGKPVPGKTSSTYKLKGKDKGKKMSVVVTGTKPDHTSASATSPQTKKVKKKKKKK